MRGNNLTILVVALSIAAGSVVVAGCGGGGSKSSAAQAQPAGGATPAASHAQPTSEDDCMLLGRIPTHLALANTGFDYVGDRDFIDGYADRAPDEISDSVDRLRDLLDKFASAAEKAGLKPDDMPLPDQAEEIMGALDYSEGDKAENARALQSVEAWTMNGCTA